MSVPTEETRNCIRDLFTCCPAMRMARARASIFGATVRGLPLILRLPLFRAVEGIQHVVDEPDMLRSP